MTRGITPNNVTVYRRHKMVAQSISSTKATTKTTTKTTKNPTTTTTTTTPLEEIHHNTVLTDDDSSSSQSSSSSSDIESPTKRYKGMVMQQMAASTPYTNASSSYSTTSSYSNNTSTSTSSHLLMTPHGRSFGEELDANHQQQQQQGRVIIDTSLLRFTESGPTTTLTTTTTTTTNHPGGGGADESIASDSEVSSVAHLRGWLDEFGQLQKKHFQANIKIGQAPVDAQRPTRPKVKGAVAIAKPTPLPPPAACALAKRLVDTGLPSCTPMRMRMIQTQPPAVDVRATDEGYKSVKELSAWLADDPTKSKQRKTRCLRRGANVIAKSRAFDKGLKDVIIEQDYGYGGSISGLVAAKKQLLSSSNNNTTTAEKNKDKPNVHHSGVTTDTWPTTSASDVESVCVSHKKQWLVNAFQSEPPVIKAHTEVITAQDEREAVSNRAKHLWRQRSKQATVAVAPVKNTFVPDKKQVAIKPVPVAPSTNTKRTSNADSGDNLAVSPSKTIPSDTHQPEENTSPPKYGFSAAREFLVQNSRQNGNPVDVAKVKCRTAKFERQAARRRTSQPIGAMVKSSWVEDDTTAGRPSFVKTFVVPNTAPKKAIHELP